MEFNTLSLILCIALVVIGIVCFFIGITYRKKVAEKEIGSAEEEARRIINESIKGGENKKREMLLEAKEEIHKSRTEYEKEVKERRSEIQKQERRLQQKEESLDKKLDLHEKKISLAPPIKSTKGRCTQISRSASSVCSRTSIPPVVSPLMPSFTISQPVSCAHSLVHRWDGRTPYPKVRLSPTQISFILTLSSFLV